MSFLNNQDDRSQPAFNNNKLIRRENLTVPLYGKANQLAKVTTGNGGSSTIINHTLSKKSDNGLNMCSIDGAVNAGSGEKVIETVRSNIKSLIVEAGVLINDPGAEELLVKTIEKLNRNKDILKSLIASSEASSCKTRDSSTKVDERGLRLNELIPPSQLEAWEKDQLAFEQGARNDSVNRYLVAFKDTLHTTTEDIRKLYIPKEIPFSFDVWSKESVVLTCETWEQARQARTTRFVDDNDVMEYGGQLFQLEMKGNQSVKDFTTQFLELVYKAGWSKTNRMISMAYLYRCFYKPCLPSILTCLRSKGDFPADCVWPIDEISKIARNLYGDKPVGSFFHTNHAVAGHKRPNQFQKGGPVKKTAYNNRKGRHASTK
ncbi:unnamed protein product [Mucor hiemalis]